METGDNKTDSEVDYERWKGDYLFGCFRKSLASADEELTEAIGRYHDSRYYTMVLECERMKSGIDEVLLRLDRMDKGESR